MKAPPILAVILALSSVSLASCSRQTQEADQKLRKVTATTPQVKDVTVTERYVCHIHSHRHIEVSAMKPGYLEAIPVSEGQTVKKGEVLFKVRPILYQARLDAETADVKRAQVEFDYTKKQYEDKVISENELARVAAKLAKAKAEAQAAAAELDFAAVKAPFDGIIDRLRQQEGSLVERGDVVTTLSDNSLMWVYFNVPETRYLEYKARADQELDQEHLPIELVLANGERFDQTGTFGAIHADFNHETGNIVFRADFRNPEGLLRHGQTGTVLIHRVLHDAVVIPQRATFKVEDNTFVYVIDKEDVLHRHEIVIQNELEDIFVVKTGLDGDNTIVLAGVPQVCDGEKVEYRVEQPKGAWQD